MLTFLLFFGQPRLVSYGVGDGMFRIWQRDSLPGPAQQIVWQGVKEKVTALVWDKSGEKLAFGTELGKVGTWSLKNNKVVNSNQFHKKTVYALCWFGDRLGPKSGDSQSFFELSSKNCSLRLYIYHD